MQVEGERSTSWYEQIYSVGFLHLQLIHILARSPTVTVNSAWVLPKHYSCGIRILSTMGIESGSVADYTVSPFDTVAQLLELWYGVLEALL